MPGGEAETGVNIVGALGAADGAGQVVRQISRALDAAGIEYALVDETAPDPELPFDRNLLCLNPERLPGLAGRAGPGLFTGRRSAGLWCWEADAFPPGLAWAFEYVDEVWVYSDFVERAVSAAAPVPVERFVMPVEPEPPIRTERRTLGLPDGFVFLFVFECLSAARKNPLGAIEAFTRAFTHGEGAHLVLKTHGSERHPAAARALRDAAAAHPHVHLLDREASEGEKNAMIAACDCYLSLHRAEGLGLTIAEAMFFGRPVISTGWSGSLELTNDRNSYLVDYSLRPVGADAWPYRSIGRWAEPDLAHASTLMRKVFENPGEARALADRAADDVRRRHSLVTAGATLARRVHTLAERRPRELQRALPESTSQRARRLVERGPHPPRRPGGGRQALRRALLRLLRPYSAHQREVDTELLEAISELERRVEELESRARR
jgi:glycosyltransferase involved in cell wall biosynthesis